MTDPQMPADDVDATVESPAARARESQPRATDPRTTKTPARRSHVKAWVLALAADALQIGLFPAFALGGMSPFNNVLDIIVAGLLVRWLGWHWALLPSLVAELIPGVDLVPTWTAAVWIATRGGGKQAPPAPPRA